MKTIISALILMMVLMVTTASHAQAMAFTGSNEQVSAANCVEMSGQVTVETSVEAPVEQASFFAENWGKLLLGLLSFYDLVARLTPSKKDNSIASFLTTIFNAIIPNLKKGGGSF